MDVLGFSDGPETPRHWRWSMPTEPYLTALRTEYGLEALVAPARTYLERVVQICHWTHGRWQHDGSNHCAQDDPRSILRDAAEGKGFAC